jgi:type I restriction enzyme, S subunit
MEQLADAAEIVRGVAFAKEDKRHEPAEGLIACLRTTNIQRTVEWDDLWFVPAHAAKRADQIVRLGDILISTANSYELVGKVAMVGPMPHRSTLGAFISLIRPKAHVNSAYLYYQLTTVDVQSAIRSCASTTTNISNVSTKKLATIPVTVPDRATQVAMVAYLDEQLSRLDSSVAAMHRAQANLKRYTRSLIQSLTSGNGTPTWRHVIVGDIAQSLDSMRKPVNKIERAVRGGSVPYLGANGRTGWIDTALFDEELVLVVEDETFVGRTQPFCYYFSGPCWVNNHTHVLRAKPSEVTAKYLNFALSYYPFIPLTTGSTGRRKLTKRALMSAPLALPPLSEQHRIVAEADRRLSLIRVAEEQVTMNLARAGRLRQSILQSAFFG